MNYGRWINSRISTHKEEQFMNMNKVKNGFLSKFINLARHENSFLGTAAKLTSVLKLSIEKLSITEYYYYKNKSWQFIDTK